MPHGIIERELAPTSAEVKTEKERAEAAEATAAKLSSTNSYSASNTYTITEAGGNEAIAIKSKSTAHHAASFNMESTTGAGSALNLVSSNTELSTLQVTGHETNKGTIKASHVNAIAEPRKGWPSAPEGDASAAVLSLDGQGKSGAEGVEAGSVAQMIFVTKTTFDKFADGTYEAGHKLKSATAAFLKNEDTGISINVPVTIIASGKATIEKVNSGTEVILSGEEFKEVGAAKVFELGRTPGAAFTYRDAGKRVMSRIRAFGSPEFREIVEDPAGVETGCLILYTREKKLFCKLGAGVAKEIVGAL